MAIINKPELDSIWASEGAKTKPPLDKIKQGWISEIPPHQYENWIQNKQDEFNAYVNQKGIPEWDNTTEYYKDKSFVQDNKKIYVSVRDSGGSLAVSKQPSLDVAGEYWKVVSFSSDELKQTTGQSTKDVMSQKAVTDAIINSTTGKADKTVSINAGSGLVGGGNLSASRTLSVNYGTTAGSSAQGNDARFSQGVAAFGWGNHALAGYSKTDTTYYVGEGLTQTGFRFDVKFGTTRGTVAQGDDERFSQLMPTGAITIYAGVQVPVGFLLCDGSSVSRTIFSKLFTLVGTRYGSGDGQTTFNLPDLRERFVRGTSAQNLVGSKGGSSSHAHNNTLSISSSKDSVNVTSYGWGNWGGLGSGAWGYIATTTGAYEQREFLESVGRSSVDSQNFTSQGHSHNITGGVSSASNIPPYVDMFYIIKT